MRADRIFYITYSLSVILTFVSMIELPSTLGYTAQLLPHAVLLYYWFYRHGPKNPLFSTAWIGYTLTDFASILENSYSSFYTAILALLSISFLSVAFYNWRSGYIQRRGYLALIAVGYGAGYFLMIEDNIPSELFIPIGIYALMDAALFIVVAGMRLKSNFSYSLCLFGLFIYIISDGLYAYHFFVEKLSIGEPMMGLLHFASHALFVIAIIEEDRTKVLI